MAISMAASAYARYLRSAAGLALAGASLAACATAPQATRFEGPRPGAGITTKARPDASRYKTGKPYQVKGKWYTPAEQPRYDETGIGSWYGEQFHNRYTANGEVFDMNTLSAAHKTLPLPSLVEVTNLDTGKKAVLRVNDRGPFVDGRIIDLSKAAADQLGYGRQGVARVRVRYVGRAPLLPVDGRIYQAAAPPAASRGPEPYRPTRVAAAPPPPRPPTIRSLPSGWLTTPQFLPPAGRQAMMAAGNAASVPAVAPMPGIATPSLPVQTVHSAQAIPHLASAESFSIQVGAFADRGNAERAVSQLASAGRPQIVEIERGGAPLYKVLVNGEGEAFAARDRVAALGFDQARVVSGR